MRIAGPNNRQLLAQVEIDLCHHIKREEAEYSEKGKPPNTPRSGWRCNHSTLPE